MNLYEIDAAILGCVDMETGDIIDIDKLSALEMERDNKISNIACWIKDLKAEAEAIKAEKQNLDKRQKAAENKAESLKGYLAGYLNGAKYKDARVSISYRKSESVEIDEQFLDELPPRFIKVERTVMKMPLKDALKGGQKFDGVRLVEKESIQIR